MGTASAINILDLLFDQKDGLISSTMDDVTSDGHIMHNSSSEGSLTSKSDDSSNDLFDFDIDPDLSEFLTGFNAQKTANFHIHNDHDYQKPQGSPQASDSGLSSADGNDVSKPRTLSGSESELGMELDDIDFSNIDVSCINEGFFANTVQQQTSEDNTDAQSQASSVSLDADAGMSSVASNASDQTYAYMIGNSDDLGLTLDSDATEVQTSEHTLQCNVKLPSDRSRLCMSGMHFTNEERTLLAKEGYTIPEGIQLTKAEEKILKRVRRKIRNKQSAMNSRQKKKEYVENLEHRVQMCTAQNAQLVGRVAHLEKQNERLVQSLRRLQGAFKKQTTKSSQTSTCVMVLAMSFALIIIPQLTPGQSPGQTPGHSPSTKQAPQSLDEALKEVVSEHTRHIPVAGKSRSILSVRDEAPLPVSDVGVTGADDGSLLTEEEASWFGDNIPNILSRMETYQEIKIPEKREREEMMNDSPVVAESHPWHLEDTAPPGPGGSHGVNGHDARRVDVLQNSTEPTVDIPIKEEL